MERDGYRIGKRRIVTRRQSERERGSGTHRDTETGEDREKQREFQTR